MTKLVSVALFAGFAGCHRDTQPKQQRVFVPEQPAAKASSARDVPRAVALFLAGVNAQCAAGAEPKARYLRRDSKYSASMRDEYRGQPLPSADDFRRECIESTGKKSFSADLLFALDADVDRFFERSFYLDDHPYTGSDGMQYRGHEGDDAFVEAILATDARLANTTDHDTFCFVLSLKGEFFSGANGRETYDLCMKGPAPSPELAALEQCVVHATRKGQVDYKCESSATRRSDSAK
jgi:hypothetical protein